MVVSQLRPILLQTGAVRSGERTAFANDLNGGLTKREYIAIAAMQGILSSEVNVIDPVQLADDAFRLADAMLNRAEERA